MAEELVFVDEQNIYRVGTGCVVQKISISSEAKNHDHHGHLQQINYQELIVRDKSGFRNKHLNVKIGQISSASNIVVDVSNRWQLALSNSSVTLTDLFSNICRVLHSRGYRGVSEEIRAYFRGSHLVLKRIRFSSPRVAIFDLSQFGVSDDRSAYGSELWPVHSFTGTDSFSMHWHFGTPFISHLREATNRARVLNIESHETATIPDVPRTIVGDFLVLYDQRNFTKAFCPSLCIYHWLPGETEAKLARCFDLSTEDLPAHLLPHPPSRPFDQKRVLCKFDGDSFILVAVGDPVTSGRRIVFH